MATELEGIKMARPMTHDLLRNLLGELGATVECIEITDLRDNTYFAVIHLRINGTARTIDSRPSDAISLALRTKSPIYVDKRVHRERPACCSRADDANANNLSNVSPRQVVRDPGEDVARRLQVQDVDAVPAPQSPAIHLQNRIASHGTTSFSS